MTVYKLDQFSRNKYETAIHKKALRDNGVKVLSAMENIPDTPEGIILESLNATAEKNAVASDTSSENSRALQLSFADMNLSPNDDAE